MPHKLIGFVVITRKKMFRSLFFCLLRVGLNVYIINLHMTAQSSPGMLVFLLLSVMVTLSNVCVYAIHDTVAGTLYKIPRGNNNPPRAPPPPQNVYNLLSRQINGDKIKKKQNGLTTRRALSIIPLGSTPSPFALCTPPANNDANPVEAKEDAPPIPWLKAPKETPPPAGPNPSPIKFRP